MTYVGQLRPALVTVTWQPHSQQIIKLPAVLSPLLYTTDTQQFALHYRLTSLLFQRLFI